MTATASLTVTTATLTNIVVTPVTTVVGINGNVQFTATGVFTDNSTQDLTSQVVWSSSNASFASDQRRRFGKRVECRNDHHYGFVRQRKRISDAEGDDGDTGVNHHHSVESDCAAALEDPADGDRHLQ